MALSECRRCGELPEVMYSDEVGFIDGVRCWRVKCKCRSLVLPSNHFELVEDEWNYEVNKNVE